MGDDPGYNCGTCKYASDVFQVGESDKIECRRNHPGGGGFPILDIKTWCWDGSKSTALIRGDV